MDSSLEIQLSSDLDEYLRHRAHAEDRSVSDLVEMLLLERVQADELKDGITVVAPPELLGSDAHELVREDDESDAEYSARADVFAALLKLARRE